MRGLAALAALPFAAVDRCQLGGDLLLHTQSFVLLVGGAEEMERHFGLQRKSGGARIAPRSHLGSLGVVGRSDGQAGPRQGLVGQRGVGHAGGARQELSI